jgi:hypothetical protein
VQILSTVCARACKSVEADETVLICSRVLVPDLVENSALIEFREVSLKVEVRHVLHVGSIFGGPAIRSIERFLPPRLAHRSTCRLQPNPASNYARGASCRFLDSLEHRCAPPAIAFGRVVAAIPSFLGRKFLLTRLAASSRPLASIVVLLWARILHGLAIPGLVDARPAH